VLGIHAFNHAVVAAAVPFTAVAVAAAETGAHRIFIDVAFITS